MKRLVVLCSVLVALTAALQTAAATVELRPGILVDPDGARAYVMRPEGGVEALSIADGSVLFSSPAGSRPLAAAGGWLVTMAEPRGAGVLDLALVNLAEPSRFVTLSSVLPAGVRAAPVNGLGTSFEVVARARVRVVDLAWTFRWTRTSPLPPEEGEPESGETRGGVRIDLAALKASSVPYEAAAAKDDGPVPPGLAAFVESPGPFGRPVKAGATWAVVETVPSGSGAVRLLLRRVTAAGAALPPKAIYEGPAVVQVPSADSRHVLVGALDERDPSRYSWSLFSLETGEPAGVLEGTSSHAAFAFVRGGLVAREARAEERLVGGSPVTLGRALEVVRPDGSLVLRRDVLENEFRGPFPP